MFRKRRRPTPQFKIPHPFNPITGEHEKLASVGVMPFCAMMQVAADDDYDDYVICRGFDTRILRFIDYEAENPNKLGISVAKPFGSRGNREYAIGEIYPAFLPTQGTLTFVPPSPTAVLWRVGQNPGYVETDPGDGGHPVDLDAEISLLYDHNEKAVNWMLIDSGGGNKIYVAELNENWSSGTTECSIYTMDGLTLTDTTFDEIVYDPLEVFATLEVGDRLYVTLQGGKYYAANNAPCPI